MAAYLCFYQSITFWYRRSSPLGRSTLPYLVALNFGAVVGNLIWGHLSEDPRRTPGRGDDRRTGSACPLVPLFLFTSSTAPLLAGSLLMGLFGVGNFGVMPGVSERTFSHGGARRGRRLRLPSRRSGLVADAARGRRDAGRRHRARYRDGRLHRGHWRVHRHADLDGTGNPGASLESRESVVASG